MVATRRQAASRSSRDTEPSPANDERACDVNARQSSICYTLRSADTMRLWLCASTYGRANGQTNSPELGVFANVKICQTPGVQECSRAGLAQAQFSGHTSWNMQVWTSLTTNCPHQMFRRCWNLCWKQKKTWEDRPRKPALRHEIRSEWF
jgi:hypothetical protein